MSYSNKHLVEVICSFEFVDEGAKWDSVYFGSYFEKIQPAGFSERKERKGLPNTLPIGQVYPANQPFPVLVDQIVFRNPSKNWGIILSKSTISFHVLSGYSGWDCFKNELIIPFYEEYMKMGLGNGRRNCTVMYLNRFEKKRGERLSDYFTFSEINYDRFYIDDLASYFKQSDLISEIRYPSWDTESRQYNVLYADSMLLTIHVTLVRLIKDI